MRTVTTWSDLLRPGDASTFFDRNPLPAFDPTANGYSASNAWWLAELCRLVYRHDVGEDKPRTPLRSTFLAQAGLRQRAFFNSVKTGTQGFLVESIQTPLFAALVFRGTEDARDFLTDLKAIREPIGNGGAKVHEGFVEALDSVWKDQVVPELEKITSPIFFTGHSLGAALATLATARRRPTATYTFGSPLVGNDAFVRSLAETSIYRIVDGSDEVTKLPPEDLGYQHVGELHHLTAPPTSGFDLLALFRPPKLLADHAPINYVERIQ
jgi:triacylglycerol lipase